MLGTNRHDITEILLKVALNTITTHPKYREIIKWRIKNKHDQNRFKTKANNIQNRYPYHTYTGPLDLLVWYGISIKRSDVNWSFYDYFSVVLAGILDTDTVYKDDTPIETKYTVNIKRVFKVGITVNNLNNDRNWPVNWDQLCSLC
jgi:hypothetical protein